MNSYKTHIIKNLKKLFLSSIVFLLFLILMQHTIAPNKVFAGEEGRGCTYDNGETPWFGHACSSEAPFCIDGHCQVKQNDPPGICGEDEDCTGTNFCEGGTCKSQNDCGSLNQNQCISRTSQCFWYRGGRGDNARCVANQNKGMNCFDGACYSDQQCHRNAMKSDGSTVGFCGNGDLNVNEPCDYSSSQNECASSANLTCQGGFCKTNSSTPSTTPPPSTKTDFCQSLNPAGTYSEYVCRTSCNSDEEILGGATYCEGSGTNYLCCKKKTAAIPSATPPPTTTTPGPSGGGGAGTCETDDNRPLNASLADKTFHCKATCSTGTEEDKTGQGALYVCSGTLRCCKDTAKYFQFYGSSIGGSSTTPAPGGGTTSPGGGTTTPPTTTQTPNRPEAFACEFHKGQSNYIGAFCGSADGKTHNQFDPTKAQARTFCTMTYIDAYKCIDGIDDYFPIAGNTTCAQPPWCPSTSTTTPAPGPDANCTAYQNQTCRVKSDGTPDYSVSTACCEPNKNFECVKPNPAGGFVCQYKGGAAFTPTPGAAGNCSAANFGRWGAGCPCPVGGGCGTGVGCYKEASGKVFPPDNPNGQFCAAGVWCAQSQTDVPNTAACLGSTPYSTPTPASGGLGYQADCPNINPDGSQNACILGGACPAGYQQHSSAGTPGGTNGNRVCTEFEGGATAMCCTRQAGSTNPTVTSAPTPTPTPLSTSSHPAGPNIPFGSVGTCPAGLEGYWKGTYCDTDKSYYDVYCYSGVPTKNTVAGITCQ